METAETTVDSTDNAGAVSMSPPPPCSASDPRIFPCDNCGLLRNVAEGGNIFTLCDECWDKHFMKPNAPVVGRERSERTHQQEVRHV